jgi:hypothetical protein
MKVFSLYLGLVETRTNLSCCACVNNATGLKADSNNYKRTRCLPDLNKVSGCDFRVFSPAKDEEAINSKVKPLDTRLRY